MADSDALLSFSPAPEAPTGEELIRTYQRVAGQMVRPVAVVTCLRGRQPHAITVDSFLDVSYDPPTMAVSIYSGSRMMETLEMSEHFAISVLASEQRDLSERLGATGQPLYGALAGVDHSPAPRSGQPIIGGAVAWFELRTVDILTVATHSLVVGEVVALGASPGSGQSRPLLRWRKAYGTIGPR